MIQKEYEVQLELYAQIMKPTNISYIKGDRQVYPLRIQLMKNGKPFAIPAWSVVHLQITSAGQEAGAGIESMAEIEDEMQGLVVYWMDMELAWPEGEAVCTVSIEDSEKRLTWQRFSFHMQNGGQTDGTPPAQYASWVANMEAKMTALAKEIEAGYSYEGGGGTGIAVGDQFPEYPYEGMVFLDTGCLSGAKRIKELNVGSIIVDNSWTYLGEPVYWHVVAQNHSLKDAGYPSNTTTLCARDALRMMSYDAKEPTNPDAAIASKGYTRYSRSNIRQWLNTNAVNWYSAQHEYDAPPISANVTRNPYADKPGFIMSVGAGFLDALQKTTVCYRTFIGGAYGVDSVTDYFFLPSIFELSDNNTIYGARWGYLQTDAQRVKQNTKAAGEAANPASGIASKYWWCRDSAANYTDPYYIGPSGSAWYETNGAYGGGIGIAPACNVRNDTYVKQNGDVYEVIYPQIDLWAYINGGWVNSNASVLYTVLDNQRTLNTILA